MFLGLGGGRDRDQNIGNCWTFLEMGFKILFISQMALCLLSYILGGLFIYFPNIVVFTVQKFQIWRLITSSLFPSIGTLSIINVLFNFYILYMFLPDIEKKFSTAYILLEVLLQIFLCNVVLVAIGYPLYFFGIGGAESYIGYGMLPLLFIFIWYKVSLSPDEPVRFICFPCLIPMKYIPFCFFLLFALTGGSFIPLAIYCALGYYQFMIRKKPIIRLPLKVYRKFDSIMPPFLKQKPGYIKVVNVEANLRQVCLVDGCCDWGQNEGQSNPFRGNREDNQSRPENVPYNQRVQLMGGGVAIGGSNLYPQPQNDFKNYWKDKPENEQGEGNQSNPPQHLINLSDSFSSDENIAASSSKPMNDIAQLDNSIVSLRPKTHSTSPKW